MSGMGTSCQIFQHNARDFAKILCHRISCRIVQPVAGDISILKAIDVAEGRIPVVLRALKSAHRLRDQDIADAMGMTRSAIQSRMTGATQCSPGELAGFALFFAVPVGLFYDPPEWVTPDLGIRGNACTHPLPAVA